MDPKERPREICPQWSSKAQNLPSDLMEASQEHRSTEAKEAAKPGVPGNAEEGAPILALVTFREGFPRHKRAKGIRWADTADKEVCLSRHRA